MARPSLNPRAIQGAVFGALALTSVANAYELANTDGFLLEGEVNALFGIRQGYDINFGYGALPRFAVLGETTGETERTDLQVALRPTLTARYGLPTGEAYGGITVVAAATTLDGELSGQFGRSGDRVVNTDSAYIGWRYGVVDISYGGQPFTLGDGLVIGDGNFNQGDDNGNYWLGAFQAWRNTAILRLNTEPVRADVFWLRADNDLGDSRVAGINLENSATEAWGKLSAMYFEIFDDRTAGLAGMEVWGFRGGNIHHPDFPQLSLFAEFVREAGRSDLTGAENDADAWYIEPNYQFNELPWSPLLSYRYARYSGDEFATPENEEYRGLFFTFGKRSWDTWYQGEINGEFFLFNQNQITQMVKLKAFPNERCAIMTMFYHHELEEPQYFGIPTGSTAWSDEVNVQFEFYPSPKLYGAAVVAWATPNAAAKEIFSDEDQIVLGLFLSYTLK